MDQKKMKKQMKEKATNLIKKINEKKDPLVDDDYNFLKFLLEQKKNQILKQLNKNNSNMTVDVGSVSGKIKETLNDLSIEGEVVPAETVESVISVVDVGSVSGKIKETLNGLSIQGEVVPAETVESVVDVDSVSGKIKETLNGLSIQGEVPVPAETVESVVDVGSVSGKIKETLNGLSIQGEVPAETVGSVVGVGSISGKIKETLNGISIQGEVPAEVKPVVDVSILLNKIKEAVLGKFKLAHINEILLNESSSGLEIKMEGKRLTPQKSECTQHFFTFKGGNKSIIISNDNFLAYAVIILNMTPQNYLNGMVHLGDADISLEDLVKKDGVIDDIVNILNNVNVGVNLDLKEETVTTNSAPGMKF